MKKIILYTILFIVFTAIGFILSEPFMDISFSQLNKRDLKIVSNGIGGQFKIYLAIALAIGIIPLLYFVSDYFSKLKSLSQRAASLGIIVGCGILFWQLKIVQLNNRFKWLSEINTENGFLYDMDLRDLNFGKYLAIGWVVGTVLSIVIFRNKNRSL